MKLYHKKLELGCYPTPLQRIKTIRPEFGIPDEIEILCLMSFGYPEFKKTAKDRSRKTEAERQKRQEKTGMQK